MQFRWRGFELRALTDQLGHPSGRRPPKDCSVGAQVELSPHRAASRETYVQAGCIAQSLRCEAARRCGFVWECVIRSFASQACRHPRPAREGRHVCLAHGHGQRSRRRRGGMGRVVLETLRTSVADLRPAPRRQRWAKYAKWVYVSESPRGRGTTPHEWDCAELDSGGQLERARHDSRKSWQRWIFVGFDAVTSVSARGVSSSDSAATL